MKHFYKKSVILLLIISLTLIVNFKLVYPDNSNTDVIKAQNKLIGTLSNGNVFISSDLLDFKENVVFDANMKNALNITSLSKQFLGKNAEKADNNTYTSPVGTVTVKDFHVNFTPTSPIFSADTANLSTSNAAAIVSRLCAEYGIPTSDAQFGVSGNRDKLSVSIMYKLDTLPIFNNALVMDLSTSGLNMVSGTYYVADGDVSNGRYAKNMRDALLDFMQECTDGTKEIVITDIQLGYLLDSTTSQTTTVSPVWRIIVENTAIYYVSA